VSADKNNAFFGVGCDALHSLTLITQNRQKSWNTNTASLIVQSLFEARGNQITALWRQRLDEQFEAGVAKEAVFEICRSHREFVEIGQQGGMAILLGQARTSGSDYQITGRINKNSAQTQGRLIGEHNSLTQTYAAAVLCNPVSNIS
jgi:hypothetical protein